MPDVISVVETHCQQDINNKRYYCPDEILNIEGYTMHRKDNVEEVRRGILVYVKNNIIVTEDKEINNMSSDFKESLWLVLQVKGEKVLYGSVYRKGSSKAFNNTILRNMITRASKNITNY